MEAKTEKDLLPKPIKGVWEITYACNMSCRHCGSECGTPLLNELPTITALKLADDLANFGLKAITLSGGEPFLRKDWYLIAERLIKNGIATNIITNGWFLDNDLLDKIVTVQLNNVLISLDGTINTHDWLRKNGSFKKILNAFEKLRQRNISIACITTLNRKNIIELPAIKDLLIQHGVERWQLQLAMPMGNLRHYQELVLTAKDLPAIITFAKEVIAENKIILYLGDNIGYNSSYGEELLRFGKASEQERQINLNYYWQGCHAGKRIIGICANGNITGCLALRDSKYIAGNICQQPLNDIWYYSEILNKLRQITQSSLKGFCQNCSFGSLCLGGCSAHKMAFNNSISSEYPTCLFHFEKTGYREHN